jgi:alpha/beta superfamily hydrolase
VTGKLRNVFLAGSAGRLEGLWKEAAPPRRGSAVFAHPHPRFGGTMHSKVVYRAAQALTAAGWETLRFNFRGVGLSEGVYDEGRGEIEDFRAALEEAAAIGGLPIVAGGFSFGAAVAWRAIQQDAHIAAFIGAGLPVATESAASLPRPALSVPSLFVVGERDTYGPPAKLREFLGHAQSVQVVEIAGADHFFEGKLPELEASIYRFAKDSVPEVITRMRS